MQCVDFYGYIIIVLFINIMKFTFHNCMRKLEFYLNQNINIKLEKIYNIVGAIFIRFQYK
jgi:hypothetical protein